MKKVLVLSQMFPPDTGAASSRVTRLVKHFLQRDWAVSVVTSFPHYPKRIIPERYSRKLRSIENIHDAKVIRFRPLIGRKMLTRVLAESWLAFWTTFIGLFSRKPDLVYVTIPSVFLAISGLVLCTFRRVPLVFEVRDLTWQYAFSKKEGGLSGIALLFEKLMIHIAKRSSLVVVTNKTQREFFIAYGVPGDKVMVLYNVPDTVAAKSSKTVPPEDPFVVLYTGLVGLPQGLDVLVETAKLTKSNERLTYRVVGDGLQKDKLVARVNELGLTNVEFYDSVPKPQLEQHYSQANLLFAHLRGSKNYLSALPSKLIDYMGHGLPVLFAGYGPGRELVVEAKAGVVVDPDCPSQLANAITEFMECPNYEYGRNGARYIAKHFNAEELYRQLFYSIEMAIGFKDDTISTSESGVKLGS